MKNIIFFLFFISTLSPRIPKQLPMPGKTHFTVIIPSYNNEKWFKRNLDSVFSQNYQNFNVIYINDNSEDQTLTYVTDYIKKNNLENKVTLLTNKTRMGQLANRYRAAHMSDDDSVLVMLDGDDWFAHKNILSTLNNVYTKNEIWLTYGQYQRWCKHCLENPLRATKKCSHIHGKGSAARIPAHIISQNSIRSYKWVTSHLRTFKAWLFKQIPLSELHHKGRLFDVGTDISTMIPMVEMAGIHTEFINKVLYIYNRDNPVSCWKPGAPNVVKTDTQGILRSREKHQPLKNKVSPLSWKNQNPTINIMNIAHTPQRKKILSDLLHNDFNQKSSKPDYLLLLKEPFTLSKQEIIPYIQALEQTKSRAVIFDQKPRIANQILPHGLCAPLKVGIPKQTLSKYNNILIRTIDLVNTTSIEKTLRNFMQINDTVIY